METGCFLSKTHPEHPSAFKLRACASVSAVTMSAPVSAVPARVPPNVPAAPQTTAGGGQVRQPRAEPPRGHAANANANGNRNGNKNWTASEAICVVWAGGRASFEKSQNESANLFELSNQFYLEHAREMERNGAWRGPVSLEESLSIRGATEGQGSKTIWVRFKYYQASVTKDVRPIFNDICPGGQIPSGLNPDDVKRDLVVRYFKRTKGDPRTVDQLKDEISVSWTCPVLEVWHQFGPFGENVPHLQSAYEVSENNSLPGRRAQRRHASTPLGGW